VTPTGRFTIFAILVILAWTATNGYPQTPTPAFSIATTEATAISANSAELHGTINPVGTAAAWFDWGTSTALGNRTDGRTITGTTAQSLTATLRGLQPHTIYYYRATAYRSSDSTSALGDIRTFTTTDAAAAEVLTVVTNSASEITTNSALLNGTVNPGVSGTLAAGWFEWGTTTSLGTRTEIRTFTSVSSVTLAFTLRNLQPRTTYYFRANAYRPGGTSVLGTILSFTTTSETPNSLSITTSEAGDVTSNTAVLRAVVSGTAAGTGWFEWGSTTAVTSQTEVQRLSGSPATFAATLRGLQPRTTYFFRAVVSSEGTTTRSDVRTFTTTSETPGTITVTTNEASGVQSSSAELRGTINPGGTAVTAWFEWGSSSTLGNRTTAQRFDGNRESNYAYPLTSLQPNTAYYFRAVAQGTSGNPVMGETLRFATTRVASTTPETTAVEQGDIKSGYVIITPDSSSGAPTPTMTFGTISGGSVQSQAGIIPTYMTTDASMFIEVIPRISRNIGVAIANPGSSTTAVSLTLRDENGIIVGSPANVSVPARQQVAKFVNELFGTDTIGSGFRGSLRMQSSSPFAVVGLRFSGAVFSTLPVAVTAPVPGVASITLTAGSTANTPQAGSVGGSTALIIPQFAIAGGWATQIALVNNTISTIVGRIDVFDTAGNALAANLNGETRSTFTYSIPVGGTFVLAPRDSNGQSPF
jgi:phosphodiesterase/alkaline phosphatase D-like protein